MTDPLRPDQVIDPGNDLQPSNSYWMKEAVLALPNLIKLLSRLFRDPRVPVRSKAFAGITLGYVLSPIDFVPDFVPVLGQTDDVLLVVLALQHLIKQSGPDVVHEHWDGSQDVLAIVENLVDLGASLVPNSVKKAVGGFFGRV